MPGVRHLLPLVQGGGPHGVRQLVKIHLVGRAGDRRAEAVPRVTFTVVSKNQD
jgi:hypothetical protein